MKGLPQNNNNNIGVIDKRDAAANHHPTCTSTESDVTLDGRLQYTSTTTEASWRTPCRYSLPVYSMWGEGC